ncbi:hypothetical protein [Gracilimonas sediminicola]|uniref:ASCH domain-containing protein n=1 Tax=Gracilimonas sediminicola TaxID=2952158 RepID=A0A9X2L0M6_9BACT|nr:hypothetical protein [Gracilimonas sediminicola]MCP9290027.1 hypothetical protein [Gracilimonas sediminicola]
MSTSTKPKERPILFSTEMVRAILDGRKTETRRVIKPPFTVHANGYLTRSDKWGQFNPYPCPYGKEGDLLYVRETWQKIRGFNKAQFIYKADDSPIFKGEGFKWKPSIHMPKEASRIWLKVKEVTVERVQDITEADCYREGIELDNHPRNVRSLFKELWNSINESRGYGWDKNPWVWVVKFEVISTNGRPE